MIRHLSILGGGSQFNKMGLIAQLVITENPAIEPQYYNALRNQLARYARERTPPIHYYFLISPIQPDMRLSIQQRHTMSLSIKSNSHAKFLDKWGNQGR